MFQDTWHKDIFMNYLRLKEHSFDPFGLLDHSFGAVLAVLHELNALMSKLNLYRTAWVSHIRVSSDMIDETDQTYQALLLLLSEPATLKNGLPKLEDTVTINHGQAAAEADQIHNHLTHRPLGLVHHHHVQQQNDPQRH